jgi:TRAP-type C4-dicarboxylate transport system permease small subunit
MKKMEKIESLFSNMMAAFLALTGILVFANVIMRYFFNSGIPWGEELARFLFVWVIFLGSINALRKNNHLGFSSLVQVMPPIIKKIFYLVSNILIIACLWQLFDGSIDMTIMTVDSLAPATGIPMAFMYGVGIITSVSMFIVICYNLYRALFVKGAIDRLVVMKESEDELKM